MVQISILILILVSITYNSIAEVDSVSDGNLKLIKMVHDDEYVYALNDEGLLYVWDIENRERTFKSDTISKYTSISKDTANNIYIGTDNGKIYRLNPNHYSFDLYLDVEDKPVIHEIIFNSNNEVFLALPNGIYCPKEDEYWSDFVQPQNGIITKKRFLFFFWKETKIYYLTPQLTFIDSKDRLWMTRSFGEFGCSVQLFDTRVREPIVPEIDNLKMGGLNPRSIFEDKDQNIYLSSGLHHFSKSGQIYIIDSSNISRIIYDSEDFKDSTEKNIFNMGILVGPGAYNKLEDKVYFATSEGFYRASIPKNDKIQNPEFIFKPELYWDREALSIGTSMPILKLDFTTDNKLLFLTSNNGIGIYDGIGVVFLE